MHPQEIRALIRKTGVFVSDLGGMYNISAATVRAALFRPQPKGNVAIANYLGKKVHEIWPEWFNKDGSRSYTPSKIDSKTTQSKTICHRQKRTAA